MAKQVIHKYICDIDESEDDVMPVPFTINGKSYEIDMCGKHRAAFEAANSEYVDHATQVRGKPATVNGGRGKAPRAGRISTEDRAAISANEVRHGRAALAPRGRIRAEAIEQWEADGRPSLAEVRARITVPAPEDKSAKRARKAASTPAE